VKNAYIQFCHYVGIFTSQKPYQRLVFLQRGRNFMTTDQYVAVFSAAISFFGLLLVVIQLRDSNEQRKLESQIRLYDITRELISLGFSNPQLFEVLKDSENVDPPN